MLFFFANGSCFCGQNFGKLLLSALPVGELRRMGRGLGLAERCGKSQLLEKLCEAAKQQRLLQVSKKPHTDGIEASKKPTDQSQVKFH